jgi:hypothetical protein
MANKVFNGFGGRRVSVPNTGKAHMRLLKFGAPFHISGLVASIIPDGVGIVDAQRFGYGRILIVPGDATTLEDLFFDSGNGGFAGGPEARQEVPILDVNFMLIQQPIQLNFPFEKGGPFSFQANESATVILINGEDNLGGDFNALSSLCVYGAVETQSFGMNLR